MAYRSTAVIDGKSPAELLMGRHIRTTLPIHPSKLTRPWMQQVVDQKQKTQLQQKAYFDKVARDLPPLQIGQRVRVRDVVTGRWAIEGSVCRRVDSRSYEVLGLNGTKYRRNRTALKAAPYTSPTPYTPPANPIPNQVLSDPIPVLGKRNQAVCLRRSDRVRRPPDRWTPGH